MRPIDFAARQAFAIVTLAVTAIAVTAVIAVAPVTAGTPSAAPAPDLLTEARLAAVDGRHEECAAKADMARRQPDAIWHAQHVFATCKVFAADTRRQAIGEAQYAAEVGEAIAALELLLTTPGLLPTSSQRESVTHQVELLRERIASKPTP